MPKLWYIYHIEKCLEVKPSPKNKFVVIVCKDVKYMGFFINTEINQFIKDRPSMLACQAIIDKASYKFLKQDSYVNCNELISFFDIELTDERSRVKEEAKANIIKAVGLSKLIEPRYKRMICEFNSANLK